MSIVSGIVLFAVIWFMVLFIILPIRVQSQAEAGERVAGTPAGAPSSTFSMKRKCVTTTWISVITFAVIVSVIIWGGITVEDLDFFNRLERREG